MLQNPIAHVSIYKKTIQLLASLAERGCQLFDNEEDVKLRKIQNSLMLVLIISFFWAHIFELVFFIHTYFILKWSPSDVLRSAIHYIPITTFCLVSISLGLYLQDRTKTPVFSLYAYFMGIAWNVYLCFSVSFESMFYLQKLAFMPIPLIAFSNRYLSHRIIIFVGTLIAVGALVADFIFYYYHAPLCPLPQMYNTYISLFLLYTLVSSVIIVFYYVSKITNEAEDSLFAEQERSERLLLNILPVNVAEELKTSGRTTPVKFDQVTIMLTDIAGFTRIADSVDPAVLVKDLDSCFSKFDAVMDKHTIEKLKTIGDAYLCAGGVPVGNRTNAIDMVLAALEIRDFMGVTKRSRNWNIRMGINTGPVIAGVIGEKKFTYDIWGEAVNTAGILEMYGKVGEVNISQSTYDLVKHLFNCRHRGEVEVGENKKLDMYFVRSIKKEYSQDLKGIVPNDAFMELYNTLKD